MFLTLTEVKVSPGKAWHWWRLSVMKTLHVLVSTTTTQGGHLHLQTDYSLTVSSYRRSVPKVTLTGQGSPFNLEQEYAC